MLLLKSLHIFLVMLLCITYTAAAPKLGVGQFNATLTAANDAGDQKSTELKSLAQKVFEGGFVKECYGAFDQNFLEEYAKYLSNQSTDRVTEYLADLYKRGIKIRGKDGLVLKPLPATDKKSLKAILDDIIIAETPLNLEDILTDFSTEKLKYGSFASYMDKNTCSFLKKQPDSFTVKKQVKFAKANVAAFTHDVNDSCFAGIYEHLLEKDHTDALKTINGFFEEIFQDSDIKRDLLDDTTTLENNVVYILQSIVLSQITSFYYTSLSSQTRRMLFLTHGLTLSLKDGSYTLRDEVSREILRTLEIPGYEDGIEKILWKKVLKNDDDKKTLVERVVGPNILDSDGKLFKSVRQTLELLSKETADKLAYERLFNGTRIMIFLTNGLTLRLGKDLTTEVTLDHNDLKEIIKLPEMDNYVKYIKSILWDETLKDNEDKKSKLAQEIIEHDFRDGEGKIFKSASEILELYLGDIPRKKYNGLSKGVRVMGFIYGKTLPSNAEGYTTLDIENLKNVLPLLDDHMTKYQDDIKKIFWDDILGTDKDRKVALVQEVIKPDLRNNEGKLYKSARKIMELFSQEISFESDQVLSESVRVKIFLTDVLASFAKETWKDDTSFEFVEKLNKTAVHLWESMQEETFSDIIDSYASNKNGVEKIASITTALEKNGLKISSNLAYKKENGVISTEPLSSYTIGQIIETHSGDGDEAWTSEFIKVVEELKRHTAPMAYEAFKDLNDEDGYEVLVDDKAQNPDLLAKINKEKMEKIVNAIKDKNKEKPPTSWTKTVEKLRRSYDEKNISPELKKEDMDELWKNADTEPQKEFLRPLKDILFEKKVKPASQHDFATSISMSTGSFVAVALVTSLVALFL